MCQLQGYRANAEIVGRRCVLSTIGALRGGDTRFTEYDFFKISKTGWLAGYWAKNLPFASKNTHYRDALVQVPFLFFTVESVSETELVLRITDQNSKFDV